MELLPYDETHLLFLLEKTTELWKVAGTIYTKTETKEQEGISLIDYDKFQTLFYTIMIGRTAKEAHSANAWYKWENSNNRSDAVQGPPGYGGFIPDCVNNVIFNSTLSPVEKHELLKVMMLDLMKLMALAKFKNQLFPTV